MGKIADITRSWGLAQEQRRQMLAFDVELDQANAKVRRLEAEVLDLEKQVRPLEKEVEGLNKRVQEETAKALRAEKLAAFKGGKQQQPDNATVALPEIREQMLRLLNEHPRAPTSSIARAFEMTDDGAKFHLEAMRKGKLVDQGWDSEEIWWLMQAGREYLYEKGLLK